MQHKSFDIIETKADAETGTFEATVAVFNNVDRGGDRILPGAFTKTLAQWEESGDPIPVILSHQWDNPMAHVGVAYAKDVVQTDRGLLVKGRLDIKDNEVAAQVHRLMARRSLKEFSFGYSVPKGGEKKAKDGANELSIIDLVEVGPTLKGMNPATELHSVKKALDEEAPPEEPVPNPLETAVEALKALEGKVDYLYALHGVKELPDEVKESLSDEERQALDHVKEKAEETTQETKSRVVDPLLKASQQARLEQALDGIRPAKPPNNDDEPEPELDAKALKAQSRQTMLELLTGAGHDAQ